MRYFCFLFGLLLVPAAHGQSADSLRCGHPDIRDSFDAQHPDYHYYQVRTRLGALDSLGVTPAEVFDLMKADRHCVAPCRKRDTGAVESCGVVEVRIGPTRSNPILVCLDEPGHRIMNYSLPGHFLHPGKVERAVVVEAGVLYVETQSWGYGRWSGINERLAERVWSPVDARLLENILQTTAEQP